MDAATKRLAVLGFHKIGEPPPGTWETWSYVSVPAFTGFLELLGRHGWTVVDIDAARAGLEDPDTLPDKAALLTFDDGYASMLHVALPVLEQFGHPSVLFVPTDYVGGTNAFDAGNEPEEPMCTWAELAELRRRGVSIQSHGQSHKTFSELGIAEQTAEVEQSKRLIEQNVGGTVDVFAFPFGDNGGEAARTAQALRGAGYGAAFLFKGGVLELPAGDRFALARQPVGPDTDLARRLGETA